MERNDREAHLSLVTHRVTPLDIDGPHYRKSRWQWIGALILVASASLVVGIFWSIFK